MNTVTKVSTVPAHLEEFFARFDPAHGRVIFAIDATMSRQATWDVAAQLQAQMFEVVAAGGGLDIQLVYFRGPDQCSASRWLTDGKTLGRIMSGVTCMAGHTQIRKVLIHARREHMRKKVNALIMVGDCCEEKASGLYAQARELDGVPVFAFVEGDDDHAIGVYAEITRLTGGAMARFDASAPQRLADLLKAVAAFATGGVKALANQSSEAAKLLLAQVKG